LTDYPALIKLAIQKGMVQPAEEEVLLKWRSDPASWTGLL
jgi:orotate phosphoribosyltransferase